MASAADFHGKVTATAAEIDVLYRYMEQAERYLEYGAGGTTRMACEAGVQNVFSVETSLEFCKSIIETRDLQIYISTGRLTLVHANMGKTGSWGKPISPKLNQIRFYLSLPSKFGNCDLVLIDGRYRVAAAAASSLALAPGGVIMIHDYFSRPNYHVVERFLTPIERRDTLAVFRNAEVDPAVAQDILESHLTDFA